MRTSLATAVILLSLGVAAQERPDFSGTWVVVTPAEAAGQEETIRQDATVLVRGHRSEGDGHAVRYRLDGSESRNVMPSHGREIVTVARAVWKGAALEITQSTTYPDGRTLESRSTMSLDAEGRLRLDVQEVMDGKPLPARTVVYRKR